jgi:hypothetical protein
MCTAQACWSMAECPYIPVFHLEDDMKASSHSVSTYWRAVFLIAVSVIIPIGAASAQQFDHTYSDYDSVLSTYVANGRVNYRDLKNSSEKLKSFLNSAASVSEEHFRSWSEPRQLSFLINLYNAATLQLILDHFPVKSIKDIGGLFKGPWSLKVVRLFGGTISLDNLEHDIIRKRYDEPRIHMALVCAAKSCPLLRSKAYVADKLDDQLSAQSREFLASPAGLRIDRQKNAVFFSSIFKWYGDDFVGKFSPSAGFNGLDKTERAVANFAGTHIGPADQAFLSTGGYSIRYIDYDWSLNTQ